MGKREEARMAHWARLHADPAARAALGPETAEGWRRSLSMGIDRDVLPPPVSRREMERVKRACQKIFVNASSILNPMYQRSPYPLLGTLLFSTDGVLVAIFGPTAFRRWAAEHHIRKGTNWAESAIGTSIFSVGIGSPAGASLSGQDSYARFLLTGAYYLAPICMPDGAVAGGLALATPAAYESDYLRAMASMSIRMIELQMLWFDICETYGDASEGQGIITLDRSCGENRLLIMSKEAFRILGLPAQEYYYGELERYIDPPPRNRRFWEVIRNNGRVNDMTMELSVGGVPKTVNISTACFSEEKFHMQGLSISISSLKRIGRLVSKYSGNTARYRFQDVLGESTACADLVSRAKTAARADSNILLLGESGVGKEVIAQSIHNASDRGKGPFVAVNCAVFSKELISSELFGYESGAFTGAKKGGNIGKFELAHNGTLFLDEIGDMPLDLQALLLRVLEERSFMKLGGSDTVSVNVRVIAATNLNLAERIQQGLFREDLFYRIGIVRIHVPPLRARGEDVLLLANHFIPAICVRLGKPVVTLSEETRAFFLRYAWPGNIRELQNLLEGIISTGSEGVLALDTVQSYLGQREDRPIPAAPRRPAAPLYDERGEIEEALRVCRNSRTKAAAMLGISRRTFYRRLEKYGLI